MLNKIIKRAIMGFVYGVFIGQTILILESLNAGTGSFCPVSEYLVQHASSTLAAVIIQYFVTGLIGISFSASTVIFEIDKWSITAQTALHFVITFAVMLFAGFVCGWFPHTLVSTLIWFGVFIVVYVIFWISFSSYYKKKVQNVTVKVTVK